MGIHNMLLVFYDRLDFPFVLLDILLYEKQIKTTTDREKNEIAERQRYHLITIIINLLSKSFSREIESEPKRIFKQFTSAKSNDLYAVL